MFVDEASEFNFEDFPNSTNENDSQMSLSMNTNVNENIVRHRVYKKNFFSRDEDEYLKYLVKSIGQNWYLISKGMQKANFNKNVRQCRDRYFHYLDPNINSNIFWSQSEDENLLKFFEK